MDHKNLLTALNLFGKEYVKELKHQIKDVSFNGHKKWATGNMYASIDYRLKTGTDIPTIEIIGAHYLSQVDQGREKGTKMIPGPTLGKWAKYKGFKKMPGKTWDEVGWGISRGIFKNGIKATHILQKAQDAVFANKDLMDKISMGQVKDIENYITIQFKDISVGGGSKVEGVNIQTGQQ